MVDNDVTDGITSINALRVDMEQSFVDQALSPLDAAKLRIDYLSNRVPAHCRELRAVLIDVTRFYNDTTPFATSRIFLGACELTCHISQNICRSVSSINNNLMLSCYFAAQRNKNLAFRSAYLRNRIRKSAESPVPHYSEIANLLPAIWRRQRVGVRYTDDILIMIARYLILWLSLTEESSKSIAKHMAYYYDAVSDIYHCNKSYCNSSVTGDAWHYEYSRHKYFVAFTDFMNRLIFSKHDIKQEVPIDLNQPSPEISLTAESDECNMQRMDNDFTVSYDAEGNIIDCPSGLPDSMYKLLHSRRNKVREITRLISSSHTTYNENRDGSAAIEKIFFGEIENAGKPQ